MSSLTGNAFIDRLYGFNTIYGKVSDTPPLVSGQSALVVSDGSIAGTVDGNIYLIPFGGSPIDLTAGASGSETGANVGTGDGLVFRDKTGSDLNFRTIADGTGINVTTAGDEITIDSLTTGANVGGGSGIFRDGTGDTLNFKTLVAGANVTLTPAADTITIAATSGGGGGYEDLDTSAATNPDASIEVTAFNLNTGGNVPLTLGDGTTLGQKKKLLIIGRTASSELTLTITTFVNGTGLHFDVVGMSASLIWTSGGWAIDGGAGSDLLP